MRRAFFGSFCLQGLRRPASACRKSSASAQENRQSGQGRQRPPITGTTPVHHTRSSLDQPGFSQRIIDNIHRVTEHRHATDNRRRLAYSMQLARRCARLQCTSHMQLGGLCVPHCQQHGEMHQLLGLPIKWIVMDERCTKRFNSVN